jgi:hypothetical protein
MLKLALSSSCNSEYEGKRGEKSGHEEHTRWLSSGKVSTSA